MVCLCEIVEYAESDDGLLAPICQQVLFHALIMHDDDVGIGQPAVLLLYGEFVTAERPKVMDDGDDFRSLGMGESACRSEEFFHRILKAKHVSFVKGEQYLAYGNQPQDETHDSIAAVVIGSEVLVSHVPEQHINVYLCFVAASYLYVVVHLLVEWVVFG